MSYRWSNSKNTNTCAGPNSESSYIEIAKVSKKYVLQTGDVLLGKYKIKKSTRGENLFFII